MFGSCALKPHFNSVVFMGTDFFLYLVLLSQPSVRFHVKKIKFKKTKSGMNRRDRKYLREQSYARNELKSIYLVVHR